jgi:hypothetical protein
VFRSFGVAAPAIRGLRGSAQPYHADLFGLAGEFYRDMLAKNQRNPGGAGQWLAEIEKYTRAHSSPLTGFYDVIRQHREFRYGPDARKLLADRGYILDQGQFTTFVKAFAGASKLGAEQLLKNAGGDYTPDSRAHQFPKFEPRMVGPELDLWTTWEKYSPRLKPATRKRWRSVMRGVEKRFGRDLATLSLEGLVQWRDELLKDRHPTTVSEVYLAAVRWILNRCVNDRKLLANVAFGIEVEKSKTPKLREREFTMEEVKLILRATKTTPSPLMSKENAAARRWIPWIPDLDDEALVQANIDELRKAALLSARPSATQKERKLIYRVRSKAIHLYVLSRADGQCEGCHAVAPFRKADGHPYIEPHHTTRLADDGPDHPAKVIGLCPNCHRRAHYSEDAKVFNRSLERKLASLER